MKHGLSIIDRFVDKIFYSPDGCWYWTATINSKGYGLMSVSAGVTKLTHRLSYQIFKGAIDKGLLVCHSCDNKLCVNPDHLWLGTNSDNMKDMYRKGRGHKEFKFTSINTKKAYPLPQVDRT